jgi:hypothetical protein
MFRINPARLVYLKFRATIAKGIAGNNVPTAAIVIPLSKKYSHLESINLQHFLVTNPPLAGEVPEGRNVFTEQVSVQLGGSKLTPIDTCFM